MYLEYFLSALDVRVAYDDLSVETSGTQQSRVKDIAAVCRRHYDNGVVLGKAVHFNKELVQGLLALVMTAAETRASLTSYCVDLINEDDRRSFLLRLLEQVAHT